MALLLLGAAEWMCGDWSKRTNRVVLMLLALFGVYVAADPFLATIENNSAAYAWSLIALLPLMLVAGICAFQSWPKDDGELVPDHLHYPYGTAVAVAVFIALLYALTRWMQAPAAAQGGDLSTFEIVGWSVLSHVLIALVAFSVLNLVLSASVRARRPVAFFTIVVAAIGFGGLTLLLLKFLNDALDFGGWAAGLFAASFAGAVVLFFASTVVSIRTSKSRNPFTVLPRRIFAGTAAGTLSILTIFLPRFVRGSDWNGLLQHGFALFCWIMLFVCTYALFQRRTTYSVAVMLAVIVFSGVAYKTLQATEILWAKPLGETDDEVARAMQNYAAADASFELVRSVLSSTREEPCGGLCVVLREYTNIRDAHVAHDLALAGHLARTTQDRPNIFFFVIDSLRPDYLGAYNPRVDFTPNLDAFARDSVVLHNVYTQYMGTSLSEPAIWAGAEILHAHYMQPFAKVNSLEMLARVDGYRVVASNDEILSQLLSPSSDLIWLDTDKKIWNQIELCSTTRQAEQLFTTDFLRKPPVLFYTQPKNVHQFANNDLPHMSSANWRPRPGFNDRIAYELHQVDGCFGDFVSFLKARGVYDNSIIILTSDHGDATGEFGRFSHSLSIYPEIMHVPLIVHLPAKLRDQVIHDDRHLSALTDITPSLYYLLGHRTIEVNLSLGHPLFVENGAELDKYRRNELFLASDERAVYGLLTQNGRFLYTTYDSPAQSFLFDLNADPNALHSILTPALKKQYDERIIEHLQALGDFYGYKPSVGSLLAAK